jgi:hypothetical protein
MGLGEHIEFDFSALRRPKSLLPLVEYMFGNADFSG